MENTKATILLMGNSGAGKSTLVNAVFDTNIAVSGTFGIGGTTQRLKIYTNEILGYRVIDTKGLELNLFQQIDAIGQIKSYIKETIKQGEVDAAIDVIWYCVDASGKRFFNENVKQIQAIYKTFPNVPVIIVLTKSFCALNEREENESKIKETIRQCDVKGKIKFVDVVSVNSVPFITANNETIPIYGINELVDKTNEILPDAKRTSEENMNKVKIQFHEKHANIVVATATSAAVAVGAVPIPMADAPVLTAIQTGMVKAIATIYDVDASILATAIIQASIVSNTAKLALSAIKAIPGINVGAAILNAVVAGVFTVAIGETTIYICPKIDEGEIDVSQIEEIASEKIPAIFDSMMPYLKKCLDKINKGDKSSIKKLFSDFFKNKKL